MPQQNSQDILVNGNAYDWVSMTFSFMGNPDVIGVASINYSEDQVKKDNYFAGKYPSNRGRGQVTYSAEIELDEIEIRKILNALPAANSLKDIPPFSLIVIYLPDGATTPVTDIISYVEFTGQKIESKAGDTGLMQKLKLICAGIQWGRPA